MPGLVEPVAQLPHMLQVALAVLDIVMLLVVVLLVVRERRDVRARVLAVLLGELPVW